MVEFCKFCGESLHTSPAITQSGLMIKWTHHAIDAMFWIVDETVRWWEIGKLSIIIKSLRRQRAAILHKLETESSLDNQVNIEKQQALAGMTEELGRASNREEFLRSKCWALTPEILFITIFLFFTYGLVTLNPAQSMAPRRTPETVIFRGQVSRVRDLPFNSHSVITVAEWFDNKLYIGGDGGLTIVDPITGTASQTTQLPPDFFVRDLAIDGERLFIGGFSGIYVKENTVFKPYYLEKQLPVKMVNALELSGRSTILIGTVGRGMLRGNIDSAVMVLGTQNRTIKAFGKLGKELWIMHEDGILTGRTDNFEPLNLQVLAGRHLRSMVTTDRNVFIGTDQGVIAGYRNARNWVWTLLSAGKPGYVNDLIVSGDILFIGSDEGVYRFSKGRMERISAIPCQALAAGNSFLAAVNPDSIMLFYFSGAVSDPSQTHRSIPQVGTFTPGIPVVSMIPLPNFQYGRLPDFSQINKPDKELELTESSVATHTVSAAVKPHVELPPELQRPVFSDIISLDNSYLLATLNRGVWNYDGENWKLLEGLPQTALSSLAKNDSACIAYGHGSGIFKINDLKGRNVLSPPETDGLLNVFIDGHDRFLLLFNSGEIKSLENGNLEKMFNIPGEFRGEFHSLWRINNKHLVVVDKGIMVHEEDRQWNLVFFKGRIDNTRIADAAMGSASNLYIALEDGRIFEYANDKLDFVGVINDQPVSMNFDHFLWVAGRESLYFLENRSFVTAPFHTSDRILGAFPKPETNSVMVFTDHGVKLIAGR